MRFNAPTAFKELDDVEKGYLTLNEMKAFLIGHGLSVSKRDVYDLMRLYDVKNGEKMTYVNYLR